MILVLFHPKRPEHWWARTYGHVSLLTLAAETWVHTDLSRDGLSVRPIYARDDVDRELELAWTETLVVRPRHDIRPGGAFWAPLTCVSLARHALGVRSCALSPDGLLRTLLRDYNAEVLNAGPEVHATRTVAGGSPAAPPGEGEQHP